MRARARDATLLAEFDGEIRTTIRQNMIPDLAHGLVAQDTPGAGSLFPQPKVLRGNGDSVLLDDLTGPCIRVVVSGDSAPLDVARLNDSLKSLQARVVVLGPNTSGMDGDVLQVEEDGAVIAPWLDGLGRAHRRRPSGPLCLRHSGRDRRGVVPRS